MALNPMPVGARVTIRPSSKFYGIDPDTNPADEVGTIEEVSGRIDYYRVRWLHSNQANGYRRKDLKYWKGRAPKRKPEPVIDPADLQGLIDKAISDCKKENQNVTARYAFIKTDGTITVSQNTACHHSVMSYNGDKSKVATIVTCINGHKHQPANLTEKQSLKFYDWLFNRSPYAEAFTSKDAVSTFKERKYAVMNVSAPANMLQGALITTRQPWEHSRVVKVFCKLVDRGVEENTAYMLGSLFAETADSEVTISMHNGGHFNLDPMAMGVEDCRAFCENKPYKLTKPFNKGGNCMAVHGMFCKGNSSTRTYLRKLVAEIGAETGKVNTNPFAAAKKRDREDISYDKLANHVKTKGIFV